MLEKECLGRLQRWQRLTAIRTLDGRSEVAVMQSMRWALLEFRRQASTTRRSAGAGRQADASAGAGAGADDSARLGFAASGW